LERPEPAVRKEAAEALVGGLARSSEGLHSVFRDPAVGLVGRLEVVEAIGRLKVSEGKEPLLEELDRAENKYLKGRVIRALGRLGDPAVAGRMARELSDADPTVRLAAAEALSELKDPDTVEALIRQLKEAERLTNGYGPVVKAEVVQALGTLGDPRAVDPLLEELQGEHDLSYRLEVADALGAIGEGRTRGALEAFLNDLLSREPDDPLVRGYWQQAVDRIRAAIAKLG
jgi:HEAT repeat protein